MRAKRIGGRPARHPSAPSTACRNADAPPACQCHDHLFPNPKGRAAFNRVQQRKPPGGTRTCNRTTGRRPAAAARRHRQVLPNSRPHRAKHAAHLASWARKQSTISRIERSSRSCRSGRAYSVPRGSTGGAAICPARQTCAMLKSAFHQDQVGTVPYRNPPAIGKLQRRRRPFRSRGNCRLRRNAPRQSACEYPSSSRIAAPAMVPSGRRAMPPCKVIRSPPELPRKTLPPSRPQELSPSPQWRGDSPQRPVAKPPGRHAVHRQSGKGKKPQVSQRRARRTRCPVVEAAIAR